VSEDVDVWRRRAAREREARLAAEEIGERATRELYDRVLELEATRRRLEELVRELGVPVMHTWPGVLTFPIVGSMSRERSAQLRGVVLAEVRAERAKVIILEMSALGSIDTAALRGLLDLAQNVRLMGCRTLLSGVRSDTSVAIAAVAESLEGLEAYGTQGQALMVALGHLGQRIAAR
jgi:anti-anti-sigma regulatory factor